MRRKAVAVLLALVMAVFALTGCTKTQQGTITLYDGNGLKIEREGVETRIKGALHGFLQDVRALRGKP